MEWMQTINRLHRVGDDGLPPAETNPVTPCRYSLSCRRRCCTDCDIAGLPLAFLGPLRRQKDQVPFCRLVRT